jgi:hypothetical protein
MALSVAAGKFKQRLIIARLKPISERKSRRAEVIQSVCGTSAANVPAGADVLMADQDLQIMGGRAAACENEYMLSGDFKSVGAYGCRRCGELRVLPQLDRYRRQRGRGHFHRSAW